MEIHILGYLFDADDPAMIEASTMLGRAREARAGRIVEKLSGAGIVLGLGEVMAFAGRGTVGRLHVARLLLERGHVSDIQDAFNRLIGNGGPAYVPRRMLPMPEVVSIIVKAGGVAIWAHPGKNIAKKGLLDRMVAAGLGGLEAWHPIVLRPDRRDRLAGLAPRPRHDRRFRLPFPGGHEGPDRPLLHPARIVSQTQGARLRTFDLTRTPPGF